MAEPRDDDQGDEQPATTADESQEAGSTTPWRESTRRRHRFPSNPIPQAEESDQLASPPSVDERPPGTVLEGQRRDQAPWASTWRAGRRSSTG
jgi:hypothetical protein